MIKPYLKLIDTSTAKRCDVTPLFAVPDALLAIAEDIWKHFDGTCDLIVGIDALGFILGTAVAMTAKKGFLPLRKGGKLPSKTQSITFTDYSGSIKSLEIREDIVIRGMRVLIVDDWVETGSQASAAATLIEQLGGIVAGIAAINIDQNENIQKLQDRYICFSVMQESV